MLTVEDVDTTDEGLGITKLTDVLKTPNVEAFPCDSEACHASPDHGLGYV